MTNSTRIRRNTMPTVILSQSGRQISKHKERFFKKLNPSQFRSIFHWSPLPNLELRSGNFATICLFVQENTQDIKHKRTLIMWKRKRFINVIDERMRNEFRVKGAGIPRPPNPFSCSKWLPRFERIRKKINWNRIHRSKIYVHHTPMIVYICTDPCVGNACIVKGCIKVEYEDKSIHLYGNNSKDLKEVCEQKKN